jgi:hypothetical protein
MADRSRERETLVKQSDFKDVIVSDTSSEDADDPLSSNIENSGVIPFLGEESKE